MAGTEGEFGLRRVLGLWDLVAIEVGTTIGAGVFSLTALAAARTGPSTPLAFLAAAVPVVFLMLVVASLGSALPTVGGAYRYPARLFSPRWAFAGVWCYALGLVLGALPLCATQCAHYLGALWPGLPVPAVAAGLLTVFWAINLAGVSPAAAAQAIMVVVLVAALLLFGVGGLPTIMPLKLLEPLRELFKDEVREVGQELGLPDSLVWRHPFPGPGLAIRILGEVTADKLDILREADAIVSEMMLASEFYRQVWQAFAVLLPIRTVGVMGDERTYEFVVALRIVDSIDAMTADWSRLPHEFLAGIANRIINEVRGINRVCYDISSKPPATIEWE